MTQVVSKPNVTVNKLPSSVPTGLDAQKILVIGQKLSTGGAVAGSLVQAIQKDQVKDYFGDGSQLQNALNAMFDVFTRSGSLRLPQIDVIPLADHGSGVAATATIVVSEVGGSTNAATKAGTISIIVCSEYNHQFDFDVAVGDSISDLADEIEAAINAVTSLPVTASNSTGTITLTARNKGTIGNSFNLKAKGLLLSGSDYVLGNIEIALTAFASGATNPTMPTLATVVGDTRYQTVVHPAQYGTSFSADSFLDDRFNVDNNILDGVVIVKSQESLANLKTACNALNSQSIVYLCDKLISSALHKGSAIVELDYVISARFAALRALRLTEGSNLTRVSIASAQGALDASGGAHIASLPYFNTPMYGVAPIDTAVGFNQTEIEELKTAGGSIIGNNVVGNIVILGEIVTTYKTNASGATDSTWKFLETVDTMSACAEYIFRNLKSDFAQSRLTEGNVVQGYSMANAEVIRAQLKKYYLDLSDLALVPAGGDAVTYFLQALQIVLSLLEGKVTVNSNLPIVVQLRELLVNLKTTFSISE